MTPIPRLRDHHGPALLSYGFRPFFLFGAAYAGLAVLVWIPMFYGAFDIHTTLAARDWHIHEMLFGYLPAVMTGFLLTAIPNWTGRLPLQGTPLLVLVATWAAGRVAIAVSGMIGWFPAMLVDSAFLVLVALAAGREIAAGKNWRNLRVIVIVAALAIANIAFHVEAHINGTADYAVRGGMAAIVMLVTLIGGRIIPSFTRNWLVRENPGRLPAPFDRFDVAALAISVAALVVWIVVPDTAYAGGALALAAALQAARLARWAGDRTLREPLLMVLHVGYVFVPLGFALTAASGFGLLVGSAGIHAWMAGAAGVMTLAVMTRATLGHTGRALAAPLSTQLVFVAVLIGAAARIAAALMPAWFEPLLYLAAASWAGAFIGFAAIYAPLLCKPK